MASHTSHSFQRRVLARLAALPLPLLSSSEFGRDFRERSLAGTPDTGHDVHYVHVRDPDTFYRSLLIGEVVVVDAEWMTFEDILPWIYVSRPTPDAVGQELISLQTTVSTVIGRSTPSGVLGHKKSASTDSSVTMSSTDDAKEPVSLAQLSPGDLVVVECRLMYTDKPRPAPGLPFNFIRIHSVRATRVDIVV
ncbi:hypothetical protein C8R43DRAFT_1136626 [Mycena crocata]|nr:hypothetical protein C8R43DRAFT_1136626 [Mycena crocata]